MIQTDMPCSQCGKPMIGIALSKYYVVVCDNFGCGSYRQIKGNIERPLELGSIFMPAPLPDVSPPRGRIREKGK